MTRGEMKTNIRYALGLREPEEQPMIEQAIYQGICDVLSRTSCFVQCIDAEVPDNKWRIEFAAAGPTIKALHVIRGNVVLDRVTFPPSHGCFTQIGQILFFADAFAVGEKLSLYAVMRPPKMGSDDDAIESEQWGGIREEWQDAVEHYACARLASRADDGTSSMGGSYWIMYVGQDGAGGRIAEIKRQVNRMSGMTLGPARLRTSPDGYRAGYWRTNGDGNGVNGVGYIGPNSNDLLAALDPALRLQVERAWNGE